MSHDENTYCRGPAAKQFNRTPNWVWMPSHNTGIGDYDSGFPDAIAAHLGPAATAAERALAHLLACQMMSQRRLREKLALLDDSLCGIDHLTLIECKAAFGTLKLGSDDAEDGTTGWHGSQRNWYETVAEPLGLDYRILLWMYPARKQRGKPKPRVSHTKARVYLVTPADWYALEGKTDRKSIAMNAVLEREYDYKHVTVETFWSGLEVSFETLPQVICPPN